LVSTFFLSVFLSFFLSFFHSLRKSFVCEFLSALFGCLARQLSCVVDAGALAFAAILCVAFEANECALMNQYNT
jgi:hypothetical protein